VQPSASATSASRGSACTVTRQLAAAREYKRGKLEQKFMKKNFKNEK